MLWPVTDVAHEANKDIGPGKDADLSVHFDNELGASGIKVTKDGATKRYDVGFGEQALIAHAEDFTEEVEH